MPRTFVHAQTSHLKGMKYLMPAFAELVAQHANASGMDVGKIPL
jgi:hypothetical protein